MDLTIIITGLNNRHIVEEPLRVSGSEIWSHVVRVARSLRNVPDVRLRVVDADGGILVLTSVTAALLSSEVEKSAA
jgi:hypothetical protein